MARGTKTTGAAVPAHPLPALLAICVVGLSLYLAPANASAASASQTQTPSASAIASIVRATMAQYQLRAVIVRVTLGNRVLATQAFGTSMDGVPATTAMHFRNGAVAFEYVSTLLLEYVDEHKVTLNETIDHWLPDLPESHQVTLKMLANQTSGYPDFETDPTWNAQFNSNPFQIFSYQERLKDAFNRPLQFAPGTNWSYSHTNFMILGKILSMIGRAPLASLLQRKVLTPMGLTQTSGNRTSFIPNPVLHSFSSERRAALGVPASASFYEESTFWNAQWGTPDGASETTDIYDMAKTAVAVGTGKLLTRSSYHAMTDPNLLGFGQKQPNCVPSCFTQIPAYNYGLGVVRSGSWLLQNPLLGGYSASEAYLPSKKIAIAVVTTFNPGAFDCQGNYDNTSDVLWRKIASSVTPGNAPTPSPAPPPAGCS
ncbi:MAG TPA: serine hydrolase domain-containing protein [Acidimicrobiales bacterium]|nr:serine hydrolase domain-containing protein [Acidimicrobiales bacterium]